MEFRVTVHLVPESSQCGCSTALRSDAATEVQAEAILDVGIEAPLLLLPSFRRIDLAPKTR